MATNDVSKRGWNVAKTINGITRELENSTPVAPRNDLRTTLNSLYGVLDEQLPTGPTSLLYFGIGIRGCYNVSDTMLSRPYPIRQTNMNLYGQIPFRIVPIEQDLSAAERANYRMRVVRTGAGGQQYVYYYLKRLVILDETVQYHKQNPLNNNIEEPYTIDYSNLTPEPPEPSVNGHLDAVTDEINVSVRAKSLVLGTEVAEVVNHLFDGDSAYARISEIGLYSGRDYDNTANDYTGTPFQYKESIMTRLDVHYTWGGSYLPSPTSSHELEWRIGKGDVVLITNT